jgi:hypothetical protein
MMPVAEEKYLAQNAMKSQMEDLWASGHVTLAQQLEQRLTALEEMTDEEFAERFPHPDQGVSDV